MINLLHFNLSSHQSLADSHRWRIADKERVSASDIDRDKKKWGEAADCSLYFGDFLADPSSGQVNSVTVSWKGSWRIN
ncbi:unnamed protein product [Citrullus colocynthis]|uniref:Uncharacterized protein n=1 Tax=Citrullus colocynthis TaxID=252529 RepID=A0ABP0YDT7_9ROSI